MSFEFEHLPVSSCDVEKLMLKAKDPIEAQVPEILIWRGSGDGKTKRQILKISTRCADLAPLALGPVFVPVQLVGVGILPPQCILYIVCGLEYLQYPVPPHGRRLVVNSLARSFPSRENTNARMAFTYAQKKVLSIIPHVTGPFSFVGSVCIIVEVIRDRTRWNKPYHRLLFAMASFDALSSVALGLSTWPIPAGSKGVYAPRHKHSSSKPTLHHQSTTFV